MDRRPVREREQQEDPEATESMHAEKDIRIRNRMMAVLGVLKGHLTGTASDFADVDQRTVQLWVARFNEGGTSGLGCSRKGQGFTRRIRANQEACRQARGQKRASPGHGRRGAAASRERRAVSRDGAHAGGGARRRDRRAQARRRGARPRERVDAGGADIGSGVSTATNAPIVADAGNTVSLARNGAVDLPSSRSGTGVTGDDPSVSEWTGST